MSNVSTFNQDNLRNPSKINQAKEENQNSPRNLGVGENVGQGTNLTNPRRISPAKARLRETPRSLVNERHPKSNWKQPKKWPPEGQQNQDRLTNLGKNIGHRNHEGEDSPI